MFPLRIKLGLEKVAIGYFLLSAHEYGNDVLMCRSMTDRVTSPALKAFPLLFGLASQRGENTRDKIQEKWKVSY